MSEYYKNTADFLAKQALGSAQLVTTFEKQLERDKKLLEEANDSLNHWKNEIENYEKQSDKKIVDWELLVGKAK